MNYFSIKETSCKCGCGFDIKDEMRAKLNQIREKVDIPLYLSSGARCPDHNRAIGGAPNSAHTQGLAADIACSNSELRYDIIKAALDCGITRIEWGTKTWIHIDLLTPPAIFNP